MNVIDFIPTGKENRISFRLLQEATALHSQAELRRAINRARRGGEPICNDGDGYYRAENPGDLDRSIKRYNSRISKQIAAKKGLEKAKRKMEAT